MTWSHVDGACKVRSLDVTYTGIKENCLKDQYMNSGTVKRSTLGKYISN
jgi:hypothetical protein